LILLYINVGRSALALIHPNKKNGKLQYNLYPL